MYNTGIMAVPFCDLLVENSFLSIPSMHRKPINLLQTFYVNALKGPNFFDIYTMFKYKLYK